MSKKLNLGIGLTTSLLLLAACTGVSVEDVGEATDTLDTRFQEIIDTNNQLSETEAQMNEQFETTLAEDAELTSLEDGTASVIENIDSREATLQEAENQAADISEQAEFIGTYEGEDLPADTLQQVSDDLQAFSEHLDEYYTLYQDNLDSQRDYLNQIASDEANYEDFTNGIDSTNENYQTLQESKIELDNSLAEFESHLSTVQEHIQNASEDGGTEASNEANSDNTEENTEENTEVTEETETNYLTVSTEPLLTVPDEFPEKFVYDSGVDIEYPEEGVKGIYVTSHSAAGERMNELTDLVNSTDLNTMVVDVKDDYGNITLDLNSVNELVNEMTNEVIDGEAMMNHFEENDIYPIARIVVFKDTLLAEQKPEWSFTNDDGSVWSNNGGDSFVNPYLKEVWDYNIEVAIQAAKLGFKDIQFDYVRFPEGFENRAERLNYGHGHYGDDNADVINMEYRNQAVTDFVSYAREQLQPYGVDVSVDIFGYAAVVRETPGIGQSFPGIASEVDVISSMIYPSHWGPGSLGIAKPDLEPYNLVNNYAQVENEIMNELGEEAPVSRPWIQDFTASYLGAGNYMNYGPAEVTAQIEALADNGINEFLLWNAGNTYSENATFTVE